MRQPIKVPVSAEIFPDNRFEYNSKTRRGRTIKATAVERGPILANERAAAAAKARFGEVVGELLDTWRRPHLIHFAGWTGVVYQDVCLDSVRWSYGYVDPDGRVHSQISGADTYAEALRSAKHHICQNGTDWFDDESLARGAAFLDEDQRDDHYRYAGFQRAYRVAADTGEADPHRWACEHQNEHTPEPLPCPTTGRCRPSLLLPRWSR